MIKFKIESSPDLEKIGTHIINKNKFSVGNEHCDFSIRDKKIFNSPIYFEVNKSNAYYNHQEDLPFYHPFIACSHCIRHLVANLAPCT